MGLRRGQYGAGLSFSGPTQCHFRGTYWSGWCCVVHSSCCCREFYNRRQQAALPDPPWCGYLSALLALCVGNPLDLVDAVWCTVHAAAGSSIIGDNRRPCQTPHDANAFCITGPLCGESSGSDWYCVVHSSCCCRQLYNRRQQAALPDPPWCEYLFGLLALCVGNPLDSPHKGPVMQRFDGLLVVSMNPLVTME